MEELGGGGGGELKAAWKDLTFGSKSDNRQKGSKSNLGQNHGFFFRVDRREFGFFSGQNLREWETFFERWIGTRQW